MVTKLPPLSELERIEQDLFTEQLDEILERIDKESTAFVITKDGTDQVVIDGSRKTFRKKCQRVFDNAETAFLRCRKKQETLVSISVTL